MTSPPPLPGAGRERAIFVQALREFSTACQAPALMPSCPFFRTGDSGPWCLEECMDLLAQHHDGSLEGMEILEDLRVIRIPRRPRRGSPARPSHSMPQRSISPTDTARSRSGVPRHCSETFVTSQGRHSGSIRKMRPLGCPG